MSTLPTITFTSKSGNIFTIRAPQEKDAENLIQYAKMIQSERHFNITEPDEFSITLEEERKWIRSFLERDSSLGILAELNGDIVGFLDFHGKYNRRKIQHVGVLAVSVHKNFREEGLGTFLLEICINWAKEHPIIQKIALSVFSTNERTIHVYKKLGFKEEGRRYHEIKIDHDQFIDDILMYRWVK